MNISECRGFNSEPKHKGLHQNPPITVSLTSRNFEQRAHDLRISYLHPVGVEMGEINVLMYLTMRIGEQTKCTHERVTVTDGQSLRSVFISVHPSKD